MINCDGGGARTVIGTKVTLAAISYEVLDELLFSNLQLTLVYGDIHHIQLSLSNSSLHDLSCCWLVAHWLFLIFLFLGLLLRLITLSPSRSRLLSTSCRPGLSVTSGRSRLGAATESSRSAVNSIQHGFYFIFYCRIRLCKVYCIIIKGLEG